MLKISKLAVSLALVVVFTCPGEFAKFDVFLNRIYLYINPDPEENTYFHVHRSFDIKHKDGIMGPDDGDVPFIWDLRLTPFLSKELNTTVILDYKWKRFVSNIYPCGTYPSGLLENFALNIFNRAMANYGRKKQCPLYKFREYYLIRKTLEWERIKTRRIYCNSTVEVTLNLDQRTYRHDNPSDTRSKVYWFNTFKAVYEGKFECL